MKGPSMLNFRIGFLCFVSLLFSHALWAQSCDATSSGTQQSGLTFTGSISVPGLTPHSAIGQLKGIAVTEKAFDLGAETYQSNQGTLAIMQRSTSQARGFPIYFTANNKGDVTFKMALPAGMASKLEDVRSYLCGKWLGKLETGSSGDALAAQGEKLGRDNKAAPGAPYIPPVAYTTPVDDTPKICEANFMPSLSTSSVDGEVYTTWTLASTFDPRASIAMVKHGLEAINESAKLKDAIRIVDEDVHGSEASLTFSLDKTDLVSSGAFYIDYHGTAKAAIPFHMDFDGALGAVSFMIRLNPQQLGISQERLKWLACATAALATNTTLPPPPPKIGGGGRRQFQNPFKNPLKSQQQKVDKEMQERLATILPAKDALYQRALGNGKSIVVVPVLNLDDKYKQYTVAEYGNGGTKYPEFLADSTSMLIWENKGDPKSQIKAGVRSGNTDIGMHGWLNDINGGRFEYQIYIVDAGTYNLIGNTYELARMSMPDMSSTQWTAKPAIGIASLIPKRNTEFYQTQEWFNAQYQTRTVNDGSHCTMVVSNESSTGCAQWQDDSHQETNVSDPGGWRAVTHEKLVDGVALATKLTKPFASFTVAPGESILIDGFYANDSNTGINANACKQAEASLVDCGISNYTLFRIPSSLEKVKAVESGGDKFPTLTKIFSNLEYRPLKVFATPIEEKPGTYEAGWSKAYTLR
jgi:hypothetical protein